MAAGCFNTVAVTLEGELWVWGNAEEGQRGLDDEANRLAPTLVTADQAFGGSQVLMVACCDFHFLVVQGTAGTLWTFGCGCDGALSHDDRNTRLVPTRIEAQHFGNTNIVSVACGVSHSAAVTEEGTLYTWGHASGLGHTNRAAKWVPTHIAPSLLQGARVGRCHNLPSIHALVFAMGTHCRLGSCAAPTAVAARGSS